MYEINNEKKFVTKVFSKCPAPSMVVHKEMARRFNLVNKAIQEVKQVNASECVAFSL